MPGVAILNVDYTCAPEAKFPVALQEMLDVYLWLTSGTQEVQDTLGFVPDLISFADDSSGALQTMAVLTVLADMRRAGSDVPLPAGIVALYPSYTVSPCVLPSFLLSIFHPMLFPTVIMNACDSYFPEDPEDNNNTNCGHRNITERIASGEDLGKYLTQFSPISEHHYMSPCNFQHFQELSDVQLKLIALHDDPVLDNSITMAKQWPKDNVSLDVIEGLGHGFLNMVFLKLNKAKNLVWNEANDLCVRRVLETFKRK